MPKLHTGLTGGETWAIRRLQPKCSAGATNFEYVTEQTHAGLQAEHENIAAT